MIGKFEPVLNSYTISALVTAAITCAVAFNVPVTDDQRNALLLLVGAVCAIFGLGAVVARNNVYPAAKVDDEIVPYAFRAGIASAQLGAPTTNPRPNPYGQQGVDRPPIAPGVPY